MKVREIMNRNIVTIEAATPILEVVKLLLKHRTSGLPVVDGNGLLIGFLPESAILTRGKHRKELSSASCKLGVHMDPARFVEIQKTIFGSKAEDLMITEPFFIEESEDISKAIEIMLDKKISRMPVVRRKKVVGYLTRTDILKVLIEMELDGADEALTDDEVRRTIIECLKKNLGLHTMNVRIKVERGAVRLHGTVPEAGDIGRIGEIVKNTPGVTAVHNELLVDRMLD